jgi:hypothetical protein
MFKTLLAAATLALAIAGSASASVWNFSYLTANGPSGVESGHGQVTINDSTFAIEGITGIANGLAITGLSTYAAADNQIFFTSPHVDFGGVSVSTTTGTMSGPDFNFFFNNGAYFVISSAVDPVGFASSGSEIIQASFSAAPESATWLLLLAGIGGAGVMLRRARSTDKRAAIAA